MLTIIFLDDKYQNINAMEFLENRFYDKDKYSQRFIKKGNILLKLEEEGEIEMESKVLFVQNFIDAIVNDGIISQSAINSVDSEINPWSIDFPSWHGSFDLKKGKRFFIVGAEPHIHYRYLQTVYSLNGEETPTFFVKNKHPIFSFLTEVLGDCLQLSKSEILGDCYITDLFPMSPMRSKETKVGSKSKIQDVIGDHDSWTRIRRKYARRHLTNEITSVNPEMIIAQGADVFGELESILDMERKTHKAPIIPQKGRREFIRSNIWQGIPVLSLPHIGSKRMRSFWINNLAMIKQVFCEMKCT